MNRRPYWGVQVIGILSPSEIEAIIRRNRIGRLGICADHYPYVVPISYVYDGDAIYGYSGPGRKVEIMRGQPNVSVLVDEIESPTQWKSVLIEGVFEEVNDPVERLDASTILNGLTARFVTRGILAEPGLVLYRIRPERKSGRFESGSG